MKRNENCSITLGSLQRTLPYGHLSNHFQRSPPQRQTKDKERRVPAVAFSAAKKNRVACVIGRIRRPRRRTKLGDILLKQCGRPAVAMIE